MANANQSDVLGKFVWYDQMSNDLAGAEKFYSKVVGWDLAPNTMNSQKYTLLKAGDNMVGGLMPIPEDAAKMGARPAWMGYIAVDDVKKYADKVKAAGGVIHRPPTEIPNVGTFAVAGDPSGAGFLLFKGEGGEAPKQDPMKPGHIGWHELHGGDPEKSFAFYSGLFGWTKGEALNMGAMGTYQIFSTGGQQSHPHDVFLLRRAFAQIGKTRVARPQVAVDARDENHQQSRVQRKAQQHTLDVRTG